MWRVPVEAKMKNETLEKMIVDTDANVSVSFADGPFGIATAAMDFMEFESGEKYWWLARVIVKKPYRRQGLGRKLLEELQSRAKGIKIVVCPGGYDISQKEQFAFYRAMGFVELDNEGGMVWTADL